MFDNFGKLRLIFNNLLTVTFSSELQGKRE